VQSIDAGAVIDVVSALMFTNTSAVLSD